MANICDDCVFHLFNLIDLIYLLVHADIYQWVPYDGTLCEQNWRHSPLSLYVLGGDINKQVKILITE